jgi:heme exporter protein C
MIAIHPGIAWTAYVACVVTAVASLLWLWPRTRSITWDLIAGSSAELGAVFTGLMLITGSIWGRPTWGVWWVWDARLTLSALMLALLLGYLALRQVPSEPELRAKRSSLAALLALIVIPVNHFAVTWWRTLHQSRTLTLTPKNSVDGSFLGAMALGFLAMTLVYAWLLVHRVRVARLEEARDDDALAAAIEERRAEAVAVS